MSFFFLSLAEAERKLKLRSRVSSSLRHKAELRAKSSRTRLHNLFSRNSFKLVLPEATQPSREYELWQRKSHRVAGKGFILNNSPRTEKIADRRQMGGQPDNLLIFQ